MKFTTGDTVVTFSKLWYLQRVHAERYAKLDAPEFQLMVKAIEDYIKSDESGISLDNIIESRDLKHYIEAILKADARNYTKPSEFVERNKFFFQRPSREDRLSNGSQIKLHSVPHSLDRSILISDFDPIVAALYELPAKEWTAETIGQVIKNAVSERSRETMDSIKDDIEDLANVSKPVQISWSRAIHQYIRLAITGGKPGPDSAASMAALGQKETLQRLRDTKEQSEILATKTVEA